jgi:hypothetical protein
MIQDPKRYEELFQEFKRLYPEYADEVPYFPGDDALKSFLAWGANAALNGGEPMTRGQSRLLSGIDSPDACGPDVAEHMLAALRAENPEFETRIAIDAQQKAEEQEVENLLPVTKRLLTGGVDE